MAGKSSPEAMERMINNITKFIHVQQSVAQSLKSDYIAVGENGTTSSIKIWCVIDQAVAALSSNYATLSECTTRLQVLKRILEDYLSHQI